MYGALPGKDKTNAQHEMLEASKILNDFSFIDSYAAKVREEVAKKTQTDAHARFKFQGYLLNLQKHRYK